MDRSVVLSVGQDAQLKRGKDRIVYAGMPSDEVYSLVQIKRRAFETALAWNLYYPKRRNELTIDGVHIFVDSVTPDEISLRIK